MSNYSGKTQVGILKDSHISVSHFKRPPLTKTKERLKMMRSENANEETADSVVGTMK